MIVKYFSEKISPAVHDKAALKDLDSKLKGIFDLRLEWVCELRDKSLVRAVKVETENNLADILTKCQPSKVISFLMKRVDDIARVLATSSTR